MRFMETFLVTGNFYGKIQDFFGAVGESKKEKWSE